MKKIIHLVLIIVIALSCAKSTPSIKRMEESGISLKAKYRSTYWFPRLDSCPYILVDIRLNNRSDSKLEFITICCATWANIVVDTNKLEICRNLCLSNMPYTIIVEPGQEFSFPVIFKDKRENFEQMDPIKVGFVLVPPKLFKGYNFGDLLFKMKTENKNILWSDSTILDDSGNDSFEIR